MPRTEREVFESAITGIIRIAPKRLMQYAGKKLKNLRNCESCNRRFLVQERGLTPENLTIYLRMIRMWGGSESHDFCYGADGDEPVICYGLSCVPLISRIQREVFSNINRVAFIISKSRACENLPSSVIAKEKEENGKWWETLIRGVRALNNAYMRTGFGDSRDIIVMKIQNRYTIVALHGDQLKAFAKGTRPEQATKGSLVYPPPDFIYLGHYHRLGVLDIPGYDTTAIMGGSHLRGSYMNLQQRHPEILSEINNPHMEVVGGEFKIIIRRGEIDPARFRSEMKHIASNPISLAARIESVRVDLRRGIKVVLPGNHDPFDEIYVHKSILGRIDGQNPIEMESLGSGDYADFSPNEKKRARRQFLLMLDEEGYVPLTDVRMARSPPQQFAAKRCPASQYPV